MRRPTGRWLVAVAFPLLWTGCVGHASAGRGGPDPSPPATIASEVRLSTAEGSWVGKITALEGDVATFLPAPYWTESPHTIPLDRIRTITVERHGVRGRAFVYGFSAGFTAGGLSAGSSAEYDVDYSGAMGTAVLSGLAAGLIGSVMARGWKWKTHRVAEMTAPERRRLAWRLMGRKGNPPPAEGSW